MSDSLAGSIDATGITAPDFPTVLAGLKDAMRGVHGADVYLEPDSQDGQVLAIFAAAMADVNALSIAVFNSRGPATAQGEGLSSIVKINGLSRLVASYSTATLRFTGTAYSTTLNNPVASDQAGNRWLVGGKFSIPASGSIDMLATCLTLGAISASAGSINVISTPTLGWQTVTNPVAASPGRPVETDAQLRIRQRSSTALPSRTITDGIMGAILTLPNVGRVRIYVNNTGSTDSNGVAAGAMAVVTEGGDPASIASIIASKKVPGGITQGNTAVTVTNVYGLPITINYYQAPVQSVVVEVTIKATPAYTAAVGGLITDAVIAYVNSIPIGGLMSIRRIITAAENVDPTNTYFDVTLVREGLATPGTNDVQLGFSTAVTLDLAHTTLIVT